MKKLTVCLMLAAFALVSTVQAGEKTEKAKATCTEEVKASCATQTACCAKASGAKTAKVRHSMRGATLLARL